MSINTEGPGSEIPTDVRKFLLQTYSDKIAYYWKSSTSNKRAYKITRILTLVLGALVTMMSSLTSVKFTDGNAWLGATFAVCTPLFAATLAVVGGISQSFQWGATWSDMVIVAERLEKERNRLTVLPLDQIDAVKELALLDDLVISETDSFFQRLFGSSGSAKSSPAQ